MFSLNTGRSNLKIRRPQKNCTGANNRYVDGCYLAAVMLFSLLVFILIPEAGAKQALFEASMPVVVIDPGHGGNDTGAHGPAGTHEKTVTLNLAHSIADQLKTSFRVVMTRSDDYQLDISERTAVANQAKADIFISLHAGSSFIGSISGATVYFYRQFVESALTPEAKTRKPLADSNRPGNISQKSRITQRFFIIGI